MNNVSQILDSVGKPITVGAIVIIKDTDGHWDELKGFVVSPHHVKDREDKLTVAVFFGPEVADYKFNDNYGVRRWDEKYGHKFDKNSDFSFLLEDELWMNCPRVIHFNHNELEVHDAWDISALAERSFKNRYHHLFNFPSGITNKSCLYTCFSEKCVNPATRIALFNVWGSVYPMHVCDKCHKEIHGWCGDDLPQNKKVFLFVNGSPVPKPA